MDIFMLYLLMQMDSIVGLLIVSCGLCGAAIFIGSIARLDAYGDDEKTIIKYQWRAFYLLIPIAIVATVTPSTKTLAVMMGGHYAIEAAKSETGQKIKALVDATLDEALEKVSK